MQRGKIKRINITNDEFNKLKFIGYGGYGNVHSDKVNFIIKKYHEELKTSNGYHYKNPCLNHRRVLLKRLNRRNKKLKYTDTDLELVFIDNKFIGIKKKYYDGDTLKNITNKPLKQKKELLYDLIRNSLELNKNRIYNTDCTINNIIYTTNEEIKIIDLDDIFSKATLLPNIIYKKRTIKKLYETIVDFIYYNKYYNKCNYSSYINDSVTNKPVNLEQFSEKNPYDKLLQFISSIKMEGNIIFIDFSYILELDLAVLKKYMEDNSLFLVITISKQNIYSNDPLTLLFKNCEKIGINIYDLVAYDNYFQEIDKYISSHDSSNIHTYDGNFKVLEKTKS